MSERDAEPAGPALSWAQELVEAAPDPIIVIDQGGAIVFANGQTERLFGYPRSELLGQPIEHLVPERFRHITRHGNLERVFAGIARVRAVGFPHTKLNTVALRGFNDDELGKICRFAFEQDLTPRFIELMPMGSGMSIDSRSFLSAAEIRDRLTAEFGPILPILDEQPALPGGGPARYVGLRFGQKVRRVGLIAAVSEPFCDTCNRVRLSASGQLHACLGYDEAIDLAAIVRSRPTAPADCAQAVVAAVQAALVDKRAGHGFTQSGCGGPQKPMVSIGG